MTKKKELKADLSHINCPNCGVSLGPVTVALVSDLDSSEFKKFVNVDRITAKDIINVHKSLKKDSICNLLQKKDKN